MRARFANRRSAAALIASIVAFGCQPLPQPMGIKPEPAYSSTQPTGIELEPVDFFQQPMSVESEPDEMLPKPTSIELGPDEMLVISEGVWLDYHDYVELLETVKPGAYVVSQTGLVGGYSVCPEISHCFSTEYYVRDALRLCEAEGDKCVIFARDNAIVVSFEILRHTREIDIVN